MKRTITPKIVWDSIYDFIHSWLSLKPKAFYELCKNKDFYAGESYFPELKHKSHFVNFMRQVRQIIKYNAPEEYYFLYGWDTKSLKDCDKYINYEHFKIIREKLNHSNNCSDSTCILYNKLYFGAFARAFGMPVAKDIAYIEGEKLFLINPYFHEIPYNQLSNIGEGNYFVKALDGENGDNILKLSISPGHQLLYNDRILDISVFKQLLTCKRYIIQEQIRQHPQMDLLYPGSVNTLRIFTVQSLKDKKIHTLPSIVRIGAGGSFIDNGSKGGIMIGVDLESGQLSPYGLRKPEYGRIAYEHPDTHTLFDGFTIPMVKDCVEACKRFHMLFPDIHSIGWDVVVTEDGPLFIEGNDNWEIEVPQLYRGIRNEFIELFIDSQNE